jgi:hypothetical protein
MDEWMDEWMDKRMDESMNEWLDEWMEGWMSTKIVQYIHRIDCDCDTLPYLQSRE